MAIIAHTSLLTACAIGNIQDPPESYLQHWGISPDSLSHQQYTICSSTSCGSLSDIRLSSDQWIQISSLFQGESISAEDELIQISKAIALYEQFSGPQSNTAGDLGENNSLVAGSAQLDCIAEAGNTTVYLLILQEAGLLRRHRVMHPAHRGLAQGMGPHNSAVVQNKESGDLQVVDSWFFDNGVEPVIVSLAEWMDGYNPNKN